MKTGLTIGQTYKFRVQSRNDVGFSDYSAEIAVIASTYPKAPVGLLVDRVATTANQIGFTWSNGDSNGGSPILDYRISYDQAVGNWIVLATSVIPNYYTSPMLTSGSTFTFKVEARNIIGYSPTSAAITILCATNPDAAGAPTSVISGALVTIDWNTPYNSGSPITSY